MHLVQQIRFNLIQTVGKIHIYFMRIHQTAGFIPESLLFMETILTDIHYRGRFIDTLSLVKHFHHQFSHGIGAAFQMGLLPGFHRIKDHQVFRFVKAVVYQADQIGFQFSIGLLINPVHRFISGIRHFFGILGQLDLGHKITVTGLDCRQLVNAAECGTVLGGDQIGSHSPGSNLCPLRLQAVNQIFIQIAGSRYDRVFKSRSVQHLTSLDR